MRLHARTPAMDSPRTATISRLPRSCQRGRLTGTSGHADAIQECQALMALCHMLSQALGAALFKGFKG